MRKSALRLGRLGVPLLLCLALSSCVPGGGGGGTTAKEKPVDPRIEQPGKFKEGSSMKAIQDRGKLLVGLPTDIPPFAYEDPSTGSLQGFDIQIARMLANGIFGAQIEGKVEFIPLDARDRELALSQNKVDIALGRYPITVSGKRFIDYAGPYFIGYQEVVASAKRRGTNEDQIRTLAQLNNRKICTVRGSTKNDAVLKSIPQADLSVQQTTVAQCAALLVSGTVDGIAAEHVDLYELTKADQREVTVLSNEKAIGVEPYGIGVNKQKIDLRQFLNDRLVKVEEDSRWTEALEQTIPDAEDKAPPVERY